MPLCSFGFDAFHQTSHHASTPLQSIYRHPNVKKVLLTAWESTIIQTDQDTIEVWGFQTSAIQRHLEAWKDLTIRALFGDPNKCLGALDSEGRVWHGDHAAPLTTLAVEAVYCNSLDTIYVLKETGAVECFQGNSRAGSVLALPAVTHLAASYSHILFYTSGALSPLYALGSNRFSQTGHDYQMQQTVDTPLVIDFFEGLQQAHPHAGAVACGPFHSAVILDGDVYTFGWKKEGRLGWSADEQDTLIGLATFVDSDGVPVEVTAQSVACGFSHTLVMDDRGRVWTCGSNKYHQLGRATQHEHEDVFRQSDLGDAVATQCHASRWGSLVLIKEDAL